MKRVLPSLGALSAFEAAARRASFTRASEELGLTQSAVSRQIAQLERLLGIHLFERVRQRVVLTEAGRAYASMVRGLLDRAEAVTLDLLASKRGERVLHISSLATFASNWLAPRLPSFVRQHPGISFQIKSYRHAPFPFANDDSDVVIHYGEASWPNGLVHRLIYEEIVAVCSPEYRKAVGLRTASDLNRAVLLQQTTRPDAWTDLLATLGVKDINALRGPRFDLYAMIIEAALAGLGVGAVPRFLAERHLAERRLIMPFKRSVRSRHAYYVVYPESKRQWPEIQAFRRWIVREAAQTVNRRFTSQP